jgi:hypothetical protein
MSLRRPGFSGVKVPTVKKRWKNNKVASVLSAYAAKTP